MRTAGRTPRLPLAVLTALVLLAHVWLLETAPLQIGASEALDRKVFSTRVLQIGAPAAEPEPAPAAAPASPRPRPAPRAPAASPAPETAGAASRLPDLPAPAPDAAPPIPLPQPAASAALATPEPPPPPPPPQVAAVEPARPAATPAPAAAPPVAPPAAATTQAPGADARPAAAAPPAKDPALPPRRYAVPGSVRLKFNATGSNKRLDYQALGELLWLHDGQGYEARLSMTAWPMSRTITSTGRLGADGLLPDRFSDKFRAELAAHFERDRARVVFSGNTPPAPLLPGAQDQLSVFVQLAAMMGGDPAAFPVGSSISVQTVGPRVAEPWVFVFEGEELLHLPGGQQPTRKLVRSPRREYDQKVEIWLAPALAWLPARIRITQPSGDFIDQQWRSTSTP